jgi:hypothetical protein
MGLVPEFLIVLGVFIFLALSLLSALLDEDLPPILQYLFLGSAALGPGLLLMSQVLVSGGILSPYPTDPTRFGISVTYLASAISILAGLNVYLALARRKMALSSTLSAAVTVPIFMISAILVSSLLGNGGEVTFSPATILILSVSAFGIGLSIFEFLREAHKHVRSSSIAAGLLLKNPVSMRSKKREDDWEESPKKGRE